MSKELSCIIVNSIPICTAAVEDIIHLLDTKNEKIPLIIHSLTLKDLLHSYLNKNIRTHLSTIPIHFIHSSFLTVLFRWKYKCTISKLPPVSLMVRFLSYFEKNQNKLFFVGLSEDRMNRFIKNIHRFFEKMKILGKVPADIANLSIKNVITLINKSGADVVFIQDDIENHSEWVASAFRGDFNCPNMTLLFLRDSMALYADNHKISDSSGKIRSLSRKMTFFAGVVVTYIFQPWKVLWKIFMLPVYVYLFLIIIIRRGKVVGIPYPNA